MLVDSFGRRITYLRLSVTDKCNLRCRYCLPHPLKIGREEILSFEEIIRIVKLLTEIGIKKVRLTGGEPLVRKGIEKLIESIHPYVEELVLTTNGVLLANFIHKIKKYIKRINVSLDTLSEKKFFEITGGGNIRSVLDGIFKSKEEGIHIKINTVVLKGVNENEMIDIFNFAKENEIEVRFIEPITDTENFIHISEIKNRFFSELQINGNFEAKGLEGVQETYIISGVRVGFIAALSCGFCSSCNRIRLTSDGRIKLCLRDSVEFDIKNIIRSTKDDEEIKNYITNQMKLKPEKGKQNTIFMRGIGG